MKPFSSKWRVVIAALAILLILFLVRPGVSRLKARIANSVSRAVARPVEIGSVHLRLLPRPGFDLENLVIGEDPGFGAEPMLRAPEVTAIIRLTSLLRGRLDVARLELSEPSLNLVRRADGRWNWETLLEHTAQMPLAPTAKSKTEARPGFPYIEATSGRINFKAGQEKEPYALLNADFALWQESENTWGVRLEAQPLRTDMNLNDAGLLRVNGIWQRATILRETPLQFSLEWDRAQLGQLTKLISGNDKGWRGEVRFEATLKGTPSATQISADTSISDFHRYDISSSGGMRLQAHCNGQYSSVDHVAHEIFCSAPVGNGMITLHGDAGLPGVHRVNLSLDIENVPVNAAAQLALRAKKNLPADLAATGSVQGDFVVREDGTSGREAEFQGRGEISDLRLQSASNKVDLSPGAVPFVLNSAREGMRNKSAHHQPANSPPVLDGLRLEYGPFPLALGRTSPAQARGWLGRAGYSLAIHGEGEVSHTLCLASLLGLPAMKASVEGVAQMDLLISGSWTNQVWTNNVSETSSGFSAPQLTGKVQLHDLRAKVRGVNGPIEITSADLHLAPDEARVDKLNAHAGNAHWTGSLSLPRNCGAPEACLVSFNLNTEQLGLTGLGEWLRPPANDRRWYQVLATQTATPSFLQSLRASGKVSATKLQIHSVIANRVSVSVDLEQGTLKLSDLSAEFLGGQQHGNWQIDFVAEPPVYSGKGTLTGISLEQVADAMHDPWISGTGSATYQFKATGAESAEFWKSADAGLQFDLRDAILSHVSLNADDPPLKIQRWQGHAQLRDGKLAIDKGKMVSLSGAYEVSGIASLTRTLDLKLSQSGADKNAHASSKTYSITGTLDEPHVALTPAPETQARLKQ